QIKRGRHHHHHGEGGQQDADYQKNRPEIHIFACFGLPQGRHRRPSGRTEPRWAALVNWNSLLTDVS
ncbi:MAG: hypothetical protein P8M79_12755, partial [Alphaproteobacteria bacterium]|nr:hypothetical protein [Alphaproteobacteria bacterium]